MAAYPTIRTAAWLPVSPDASVVRRYDALPFPEEWRDAVLDLCNHGRPADAEPWRTAPTRRMDQVLQTFAPDLRVMARPRAKESAPVAWLYAPEGTPALPPPVFAVLRNAWLRDLRPGLADDPGYRAALREARARLDAEPPAWVPAEPELLACPRSTGGTAAPHHHQFTLSPDWLARRVLELPPFDYDGGALRFRAVPRTTADKGAELVSQPLPYESGDRTWWFSVYLNITLHTVPFDPLPRFHLHCGIRRWATRVGAASGHLHLPFGRKATVLLRPDVPWLPGAPQAERFAVARLARRRDPLTGRWGPDWADGGPARILHDVDAAGRFPVAAEIAAEPERWLVDGMRAAVVHSTAMGRHGVAPGLMSHQRSQLVDWAEQALPAELRPAPPLARTRLGHSGPPGKAAKADRAARARAAAAVAVAELGAEALDVRLYWQTERMRDAASAALMELLGLRDPGPAARGSDELVWRTPEVRVRLRRYPLPGPLAGDLALPEGGRAARAALQTAVRARREEAAEFLGGAVPDIAADGVPALAVVEIGHRDGFASRDHDPKFALRLGFARAGLLTQFVQVPVGTKGADKEKAVAERALMAWDDGLRQLGARSVPARTAGAPDGLRYAAVWMVCKSAKSRTRQAAYAPVGVRATPRGDGAGPAVIEGWDAGAGRWIPYPRLLLKLAGQAELPPADDEDDTPRPSYWTAMDEQRRATESWLQKMQRSLRDAPTLLLASAQNARSHWTWLQDGVVERDRVKTGHAPARRLDPDLRLVRVRTRAGRETAEWWGVNSAAGPNGLAAHLWRGGGDRVFWSTTPKPEQFKSSAVQGDKLAPRALTMGANAGRMTRDTDKVGWNPDLVELAVLGCHEDAGDVPEALAFAAHHLRQPPDYRQALHLPLPLHLAVKAQEYVLPLEGEEDAE
ncbi:pPIWI_RE module domain-containing protein [Actinomadura parmotrematis]|uniref:DUF3962 domain-containing protein n=1 Tax=Actinomadura parmotrematis TaxID=2864039 RepID=A0ABS7FYP0_9ACTN|nr:DUF3962 domain-containing protein [Actinomadura parmotrematis]MBW8485563.1 DUF3962 domain-containing protein [Actinomadura parmotrematis]